MKKQAYNAENPAAGGFGTENSRPSSCQYRLHVDSIREYIGEDKAFPHGLTHITEDFIGDMMTYYIVYAKGYNVRDLRGVETKQEAKALFGEDEGEKYRKRKYVYY